MLETKQYYKTSEFWLTIFGLVPNFVNLVGVWDWTNNQTSGLLGTVLMAAYAVARGQAKQGTPYTPPPPN